MVLRPAQLWGIHESWLPKAVDIIDLGSFRMPVEGWTIAHDLAAESGMMIPRGRPRKYEEVPRVFLEANGLSRKLIMEHIR